MHSALVTKNTPEDFFVFPIYLLVIPILSMLEEKDLSLLGISYFIVLRV